MGWESVSLTFLESGVLYCFGVLAVGGVCLARVLVPAFPAHKKTAVLVSAVCCLAGYMAAGV